MPDESRLRTGEANDQNPGSMNTNGVLKYVIVPNSDGTEISIFFPRAQYGGEGTKATTAEIGADPYFTSATSVLVQYETGITSTNQNTMNEYIYTTSNKQRAFDGVVTNVTGGSVQTDVEAALNGKAASKVKSLTITSGTLTAADVTYIQTLTGLETLDLTGVTNFGEGVTKATINASVPNGATVLYPVTYTVDGCNVTINTANPYGDNLATILAQAKTALGSTNICTLIVTGELTANDLIALGGTNMTGATRIDLSGATLASGVSIDNLQIPSSLEELVLPEDQIVSVGLRSKLATATSLMYAFSPSSSTQNASQAIADYVWVNNSGGLDDAISNEAALRSSHYIKVASVENLNSDDLSLANKGVSAVEYLDLSAAAIVPAAISNYTAPHATSYRIILPDNWTAENMASFAAVGYNNYGRLAAVYSYDGTTINVMEIDDNAYSTTALANSRIVRSGTTAINVVGYIDPNNADNRYGNLGTNLIAAINGADSNITSVTISVGNLLQNLGTAYTFTNTNITSLSLEGVQDRYTETQGAVLNVNGCTSLQTLNLKNATFNSVTANVNALSSLTSVDMSGTYVNGNTDLSNSGLRTLTTNSSTVFVGDLNLKSTASFTSFATQAKVTGNIYLNASGVSTVDLQSVQFQDTSSEIHIDNTAEEGSDVLDALNANGQLTIYIPTGFDRTRLHPYSSATLDDNIAELAGTGAFEDGCNPKCRIEYNAETHVATVYCYTPGHFKALMENNNNYGKFVDGAIFTFDASCKLNAEDLAALAGKDGYGNYNWNYVDLYNLPASYVDVDGETTVNYETVINDAINILRTNNWQYKGLLLPKTTDLGTTLIQDRTEDETKVATCSQFIAYSGAIGTSALTAAYIYKAADDWGITHAERLGKMKAVMNLHPEIMNTTTNWSVSTNSPTPIDMSILPTSVTIEGNTVNTSKLETVNNDMVAGTGKPSIYAYPAYENVMYTVANNTGIGSTPNLEILKVTGPVNAADIESVNQFTGGPRVLDLSATTGGITKAMLESITNANIEYIILPEGMSKDVVCGANYTSGLKNGKLKAVISSTSTNLVAYVNKAGSLAEARYLATGGSVDANTGIITPAQTGLQSVTLAGNLNAGDIAANTAGKKVGGDGHWVTGSTNAANIALSSEQGTITTVDLKNAVFATHDDMNFSNAGLSSMTHVDLPTAKSMNEIPEGCFRGIASLTEVCIPYNYEYIYNGVFVDSYVGHISTTDAKGALIDNGPQTITLSANLKQLGSAANAGDALAECVFAQNRRVSDLYVLATKAPKCYINTFPADMCYGWGGFQGGNFPYCREKYKNGENLFTVFHFPSKESFDAVTSSDMKDTSYEEMKKKYTDVNKVYSMKEQTGAVDANGDAITWPTFSELRRTYNQATNGMTWNDWKEVYDINHEVNGGDQVPTTEQAAGSGEGDYDFKGYGGWHQLTLSLATYVEPDETLVENDVVTREYQETDEWFTFCIPYSITADQLQQMLGVPASTDKVKVKLYRKDGTTVVKDEVTTGINPDVRTLNGVVRKPGTTNKVTFLFTRALVSDNSAAYYYWNINEGTPASSGVAECGNTEKQKVIAMRGGLPYIVKPYVPKGTTVKNLGKYIMERFAGEFSEDQACGNLGTDYYEQLGNRGKVTSRFVKPYEKHKIQAKLDDNDDNTPEYAKHSNNNKYYYAFIGTFWEQPLPRYSFYVTGGKWYRYSSGTKNYKWAPYKCVIMACQQDDTDTRANSGKYRNNEEGHSIYPSVIKELANDDVFDGTFKLEFLDGLDDSDFNEAAGANGAKYLFTLDGAITEFDDQGNETTAIKTLDGVDVTPMPDNYKVYNMAGQYVGTSLDGLTKGMYIVNGKKFIVR